MRRHELSDEEWALIEDLFPRSGGEGGQWSDHRQVINGLFWRLRTGAPWRDIPERYGPWQTIYDRFNRYRRDGTWDRMIEALQIRLDAEGLIDWDLWCIDGSSIRANRTATAIASSILPRPNTAAEGSETAAGRTRRSGTWALAAAATRSD